MNDLFASLGLQTWKGVIGALVLPPTPLLLLALVGAALMPSRRAGRTVVLVSLALIWLSATTGFADVVLRTFLAPPPALGRERLQALGHEAQARRPVAILVLGGGMEPYAPEYDAASLSPYSLERLRYGMWLGRATGLPVGFSGGVGHAQSARGTPEADVAAQIAAQEYGRPLKWIESQSRDTRENAARSVALLQRAGIDHVVLVTHDFHMPRALRAFREAAGPRMRIEPAPLGLSSGADNSPLLWLPSGRGLKKGRDVLHELLGLAAGS